MTVMNLIKIAWTVLETSETFIERSGEKSTSAQVVENLSTPKNLHEIKDTQSEKRGKIGKWRKVWQGQRGSKMTQAVSMSDPSGKKVNMENHKFEKLNIRCMVYEMGVLQKLNFSKIPFLAKSIFLEFPRLDP